MTDKRRRGSEEERRRRVSDGSLHNGWFFTSRSTLRTTGLDELKPGRPPEVLSLQWWRGAGPETVPPVMETGGKPQRSLCGVRTMLKLQMAACEDYAKKGKKQMNEHSEHTFFQGFRGNIFSPPLFFMPSIHLQCLKCRVDSKIRGWIHPKEQARAAPAERPNLASKNGCWPSLSHTTHTAFDLAPLSAGSHPSKVPPELPVAVTQHVFFLLLCAML